MHIPAKTLQGYKSYVQKIPFKKNARPSNDVYDMFLTLFSPISSSKPVFEALSGNMSPVQQALNISFTMYYMKMKKFYKWLALHSDF
jgi:hypothetical protein